MGGVVRSILTILFRVLDRRPVLLFLFLCLAVVNAVERLSDPMGVPGWLKQTTLILWILFGGLYFIAELSKKMNIWRLFPPAYRGFPAKSQLRAGTTLRAQYALIYGSDSPLRKHVFLRSDGVIVVDAVALFEDQQALLQRILLPGGDEALNRISARINLKAFDGTLYDTNFEDKLSRNRSISAKNHLSFAILRHEKDERLYVGLSSVVPLDAPGTISYCSGQISDNDVTAEIVAGLDDPLGSVVLFMIAHQPTFEDETSRRHMNSLRVIEDLIMTTILQVTLFATLYDSPKITLIGGAYGGRIEALLQTLGLNRSRAVKSADGLVMFSNKIAVLNQAKARHWLETQAPHLLRPAQATTLRPLTGAAT